MTHQQYDYIVVGAGSSGCVMAEQLSRDGNRVLLLEAGGSDRRFWIKVPLGYSRTFRDPRVNWAFETEPDGALAGRRMYWPRGKVLGGSSAINALCYVRAYPNDLDDWANAGNEGWSWAELAPYYDALERRVGADGTTSGDGPLHVTDVSHQHHPLVQYFRNAAEELGIPLTADLNGSSGSEREGIGPYHITTRNGVRCSSADAFLRPALRRTQLHLQTNALVNRITFDGIRATGIDYVRDGERQYATASAEVILSAGAIGSPQILLRSGIGPDSELRALGIDVTAHSPAVGLNLQDHLAVSYYFRARIPTLNDELGSFTGRLRAGFKYLATRRGPLSLSVNQYGGFIRSSAQSAGPDLQLYLSPLSYATGNSDERLELDPYSGFLLSFNACRPTSRGSLRLLSAAPEAPPLIHPNYLSTDKDLQDVIAGGRFIQKFAATKAMRAVIDSDIAPQPADLSDDELIADFRERASTVYHPVGTCMMGPSGTTAVVDSGLRVYGTQSLRVVDASIFPNVTSGNTNATAIMIAHKAAALIRSTPE